MSTQLDLPPAGPRWTHYLFRYPAKFHPPVVKALLDRYTVPGDTILDNFCGSGTSLVEAAVAKRQSVGIDVDPVAIAISLAKTRFYEAGLVQRDITRILAAIKPLERDQSEYERRMHVDLTDADLQAAIGAEGLTLPPIPRIDHWFRRYVLLDLARIQAAIQRCNLDPTNRALVEVVFASIIRNSSNADPVPVSGLEVTSHMLKKERAGRIVNPFALLRNALQKAFQAVKDWCGSAPIDHIPEVRGGDATQAASYADLCVDAVLTSPPYHNAVDYYRRHTLEMYWLGSVRDHQDRLELLPKYIGRHRIPQRHARLAESWDPGPIGASWHERIAQVDKQRANDFKHYLMSMTNVFSAMSASVRPQAPVIFVVGDSTWKGQVLPTSDLLAEAANSLYDLRESYWYPIKNRYMSYARNNGADISAEHVLVFRSNS